MAIGRTIALLALVASGALAQQYNGNYVDNDYDYDQGAAPAPPPRPAPQRSYSRPAPPPQPLRSSITAANAPRPTPVPILKQINRHNEDGSYTYGYEGADGSFKIETKLTTGEVMGKYGYVDDLGKVRVVEYGANKFGFQPSGEGITVAPPTLVDETTRRSKPGELPEYDDGSYYDAPAPAPRPAPRARPPPPPPRPAPQPAPRPQRPPPPQPQFTSFETSYSEEPRFSAPAPRPSAPRPSSFSSHSSHSSHSAGPAPPRAVVSGAAPSPLPHSGVVYSRPSSPPREPAPVRQSQPSGPPPPVYHAQPIASFAPAPAHRPSRGGGGGGGILDQLARDYALPSGGSNPLTDISFSSYY